MNECSNKDSGNEEKWEENYLIENDIPAIMFQQDLLL